MNKKLIVAAIAAAIAAPAVSADTNNVTVYGKLHESITMDNAPGAGVDLWRLDSNSSRIGFKGSEDLGNGLKAIWQFETAVAMDSGGWGGGRNTFIGLAGDWGTFLAGRHDTPNKVAFYAAGNEHLGDSIMDLNGSFGFTETRISNAIAYVSPNFSGFTIAAAIVPGEGANAVSTDLNDAWSLAAMYSGNGLKVGLGHTNADDLLGGGAVDVTITNLGASYTMDTFTFGGQWQRQEVGAVDADIWAITGAANFGNNKVTLTYGQAESGLAGANQDSDTMGISLEHSMSKRTSVYVAVTDGDRAIAGPATGAPTNGGTTTAGTDFSIGMMHSF